MYESLIRVPVILMMLAASVGGFDTLYYHVWRFKLYRQPSARAETITHFIRSALFGMEFFFILHFQPHGVWFWIIGSLFMIDFTNSVVDAFLEPKSRAPLGGLPRLEYIVHIVGSTLLGGIVISFAIAYWGNRAAVTALVPHAPDFLPGFVVLMGQLLIVGAISIALFEWFLFLKSRNKGREDQLGVTG